MFFALPVKVGRFYLDTHNNKHMKELISIQSELKAPKSQYNKFGGYKYRKAEDILEAVKPLLAKERCTLVITDEIVPVGNRIYVKATACLRNEVGDTETATGYAREEDTKKGMDGSQITGAASSYARKYALNGLFAIDDCQDSDTTNVGTQPDTSVIAKAIEDLNKCKSREDLVRISKTYSHLMGNKSFLSACTSKRKELGV